MRAKRPGSRWIGVVGIATICSLALLGFTAPKVLAADAEDAQGIVDNARVTLGHFLRDGNYAWFNQHLKHARGVLIYPQVLKAGFFLGGSGGTGVLLARDPKTGEWSQPAFYTLGSVSFGLQFGGEASETVVLVMSQKAVDSLLTSSFKLGADATVAAGPVGAGAKGDITTDFISFSMSKGLFAGVSLEGAVISVRDSLNDAYYGKKATPVDIIIKDSVSNKGSARLREELKKETK